MDYKEIYDAALERAAKLRVQNPFDTVGQMVEHIFPELKESESERIRKVLLNDFKNNCSEYYCEGVNRDMIIAWLEKQGEQKPYGQRKECEDCQFNYVGECKGYCALKRNEHKPTDNVEPKMLDPDKVIEWLNDQACQGWIEDVEVDKFVDEFKEDFGL